jgi:chloramphenicol 3-O-phosphotransferase
MKLKIIVFSSLIVALGTSYWLFKHCWHKPAGTVIILNGTSSSGKSSIIAELNKIYGDSYKLINLDVFIKTYSKTHPMTAFNARLEKYAKTLPPELKNRAQEVAWTDESVKQELDKLAKIYDNKMWENFYAIIREQAAKGNNIVVDAVLQETEQYELCRKTLQNVPTIFVLLYCPLSDTLARIKQRNLSKDPEEHRDLLLPIVQYQLLYKPQETAAEKVIDTVSSKELKQAVKQAIDEAMINELKEAKLEESKSPNSADIKNKELNQKLENKFKKFLEETNTKFVEHFKLDKLARVEIVSVNNYELVLDCKKSSRNLATEIANFVKRRELDLRKPFATDFARAK